MQERRELARLTGKVRLVAGLTEAVVRRTIRVMTARTECLADGITADADEIVRTAREIGDLAASFSARPDDPKFVERLVGVRSICVELERLGDAASYMASRSKRMLPSSPWARLIDFSRVESGLPALIELTMDAFYREDVEKARMALASCRELATSCAELDVKMRSAIQSDSELACAAGDAVLVTHTLERFCATLFAIAATTLTQRQTALTRYHVGATLSDGRHAA